MQAIFIGLLGAIVSLGGLFGYDAYQKEQVLGAFGDPFLSIQLATNPSNGECLTTDGTNNEWVTCATGGGGGGGGFWSTTTNNLIIYPTSDTYTVSIGDDATSTAEFFFDPNTKRAQFGNGGVGDNLILLGSTTQWATGQASTSLSYVLSPNAALTGALQFVFNRAGNFNAPYASTTGFTSSYASTSNLIVSNLNAASCDVKASTSGVLSCGTDATGGGGGGSGSISTSSPGVVGRLLYYTTAGATPELVDPVATTTLTASSPLSLSNPVAKVGGSNSILTLDTSGTWSGNAGTATALAANGSNCSAGQAAGGVTAGGAAEDCTDYWTEAENTAANYEQGLTAGDGLTRTLDDFDCDTASGSVFGCLSSTDWTTFNGKESALTFTYPLTRAANTVSLAFGTTTANTWSAHNIFPSLFATNSSSTNATTTNLAITSLASKLLRTDSSGGVREVTIGSNLTFDGTTLSATGGGGSGGGTWSTTTCQGSVLCNYPNNTSDVVVIGSNATSTAEFYFDPNNLTAQFGNGGTGDAKITYGSTTTWAAGLASSTLDFVINPASILNGTNAFTFNRLGNFSFPYGSTTAITSTTASTTNLIVSSLNSASCDVKASSAGVLSCGTDATGGGGSTPDSKWATSTDFAIYPSGVTNSAILGRTTQLGRDCLLCIFATSTTGDLIFASSTFNFDDNFVRFVDSAGATMFAVNANGNADIAGNLEVTSDISSLTALNAPSYFLTGSGGFNITNTAFGRLTLSAAGGTHDENLSLALDDTANTAVWSSSSGVTNIDWTAITRSTFTNASTTLLTVSGLASTSQLIVSNLNTASCDVKASTSGVLSCGTDTTGLLTYDAWTHPLSGVSATTSVMRFPGGLYASSTVLFDNATTTSLGVLNLTAASCDVKATTGGVLYCGTDATGGGGGGTPDSKWATSTVDLSSISTAGATKVGVGTTTPWGIFSIASSTWNRVSPLFVVSTSTGQFGHLFTIMATTSTFVKTVGNFNDTGVRVSIGQSPFQSEPDLDQLQVEGRINQKANYVNCDHFGAFVTQLTADTNYVCNQFMFNEDTNGVLDVASTNASSAYARIRTGATGVTSPASSGASVTLRNGSAAGFVNIASTTPIAEIVARIGVPTSASTTMYYIGFSGNAGDNATLEALPNDVCAFTASTTQANWWLVSRGSAAVTMSNTGVASSSSFTANGDFLKFRVEVSTNNCTGYITNLRDGTVTKTQITAALSSFPNSANIIASVGHTSAGLAKELHVRSMRLWYSAYNEPQ